MARLYTHQEIPRTSEEAIRQFREDYLMGVSDGPPPTWHTPFVMPVDSPRTTFPISAISTKFVEMKEKSGRFKQMDERELNIYASAYTAGHEISAMDLKLGTFASRRWATVPERFARAEERHVAQNLAAILEAGTSTLCKWDDKNFFATNHDANPADPTAGTFSNYQASPLDPAVLANLQAEMTTMRLVKDENGNKLGVEPAEIWLPTEKFQLVSDQLSKDYLANGESNTLKGKLKPVHIPELTDANDWYLVDPTLIAAGLDPMIAAQYRPGDTLGLQFLDESSDFFKTTLKIAVKANIWYGFALVFPHAIRKVVGA